MQKGNEAARLCCMSPSPLGPALVSNPTTVRRHSVTSHTVSPVLSRRQRGLLALVAGIASGALCYAFLARPGFSSDFYHFWAASRTLLAGGNPYTTPPLGPLNPQGDPFLYPLPALLFIVPVAWLPLPAAGAVFIAGSSALLAYFLLRDGFARTPIFLSAPFIMAVSLGQWSPLLVAVALEPRLGFACVAKPNLGFASWIYRPRWWTILSSAGLAVLSLAVIPTWPADWLHAIADRPEKFSPMLTLAGPALALAALRWRQPEARLFLALAVVPQTLLFYDQLALWLIPRTLRESLLLSIASFGLLLTWFYRLQPGVYLMREAIPYVIALYIPALVLILRHRGPAHHGPSPGQGRETPATPAN